MSYFSGIRIVVLLRTTAVRCLTWIGVLCVIYVCEYTLGKIRRNRMSDSLIFEIIRKTLYDTGL